MKLYIAYGWGEGPLVGKNFVKEAMGGYGLKMVSSPSEADVIFAHSAGLYFLPKNMERKIIFANGVPWTKDNSVLKSLLKKQSVDFREHKDSLMIGWWFKRLLRNIYYIFLHPSRTFGYRKAVKNTDMQKIIFSNKLYLIYNKDDPFTDKDIVTDPNWQKVNGFFELPGGHDNCWVDPQPYLKIIINHAND